MSLLDTFKETAFRENGEQFSAVFAPLDEDSEFPGEIMVSSEERAFLKKNEVFRRDIGDGSFLVYRAVSEPKSYGNFYSVFARPFTGSTSVNILGAEYTIIFKNDEEVCSAMGMDIGECGGYCSAAAKEIVIANLDRCEDSELEKDELRRCNLRHEIVHAFLNESGLQSNSKEADCWAKNEEMVDWIAIQGPKIWKAWQEAGAV